MENESAKPNFLGSQSTRPLMNDVMGPPIRTASTSVGVWVYPGVFPFTQEKGRSTLQSIHLDQSGKMITPDEDNCDYYTLYYHTKSDALILVYTEKYSNYNATSNPTPYTYTSKNTSTVTETYEGQVGQDFPEIFNWKFTFTYQTSVIVGILGRRCNRNC